MTRPRWRRRESRFWCVSTLPLQRPPSLGRSPDVNHLLGSPCRTGRSTTAAPLPLRSLTTGSSCSTPSSERSLAAASPCIAWRDLAGKLRGFLQTRGNEPSRAATHGFYRRSSCNGGIGKGLALLFQGEQVWILISQWSPAILGLEPRRDVSTSFQRRPAKRSAAL